MLAADSVNLGLDYRTISILSTPVIRFGKIDLAGAAAFFRASIVV